MKRTILIVDDHDMFRAGLRALLHASDPTAIVTEASDAARTLLAVEEATPDMIIMDLHLPDQTGIEVSLEVLARHPTIKIIILSGEADLSYVNEALQAGISGYLLKTSAPEELPRAISVVSNGRLYLCPEANAFVLEHHRRNLSAAATASRPLLSMREREVLRFIADGLRSKDMANRLGISVKTVETYRRRLSKKLGCSSTAELVRYAMREGIIRP